MIYSNNLSQFGKCFVEPAVFSVQPQTETTKKHPIPFKLLTTYPFAIAVCPYKLYILQIEFFVCFTVNNIIFFIVFLSLLSSFTF